MAKVSTYKASILNIRILDETKRDYVSLLSHLAQLKLGVTVRKNVGVAINFFNVEKSVGNISKYTEIQIDEDWFNTETFSKADDGDLDQVSIPEHLKPGLEQFRFKLNASEHLLSFLTKSTGGKSLSPRFVLKYFEVALLHKSVVEKFGEVVITLVQDVGNVGSFFSSGGLREIEIILKAPNDGLNQTLRKSMGEKLANNNASELREKLKAKRGQTLTPTKETKDLAALGATMGKVLGIKEQAGVAKNVSSESLVEEESDKFDPDHGEEPPLMELSRRLEDTVLSVRDNIVDDQE